MASRRSLVLGHCQLLRSQNKPTDPPTIRPLLFKSSLLSTLIKQNSSPVVPMLTSYRFMSTKLDDGSTNAKEMQTEKNSGEVGSGGFSMRDKMEEFIKKQQDEVCEALEQEETSKHKFAEDQWTKEGSRGTTRFLQEGTLFEKANVDASVYQGTLPPPAVAIMRGNGKKISECDETPFWACGVSGIIHPINPNVPSFHFNLRYFEIEKLLGEKSWWFGGVCDLTPYYLDEDDVSFFHQTLKDACDETNPDYYSKYKAWCDDYFRIKHRGISRGVGGIFFDGLNSPDPDTCFKFVQSCGKAMISSYLPIVKKNKCLEYGDNERQWQLLKRGHYAEFNLAIDRGTKFGLETPMANIESVLCSLPLNAKWQYNHTPPRGSKEDKLTEVLKNPKDWVKTS